MKDKHPLRQFFATCKCATIDMTQGREYLVTFNGADLLGYRGYDDAGDAFTFSSQLFEDLPSDTPWVSSMIIPIDPPAGNIDYTHMGNYKGPKGHRFTTGGNYNLIYEDGTDSVSARNDVGVWQQVSGDYFDVTHNYSRGGGIPNVPSAQNSAHNPTASDILGNAAPTPPCGGQVVNADVAEVMFDDSVPWDDEEVLANTKTAPRIKHEPASTEALREYRFKPNLF